jgi:hypothetical protein
MRLAGIVMLVMGLVALVFAVLGAIDVAGKNEHLMFMESSWFPIMFIFWGGAGLSILLTFPAGERDEPHRTKTRTY